MALQDLVFQGVAFKGELAQMHDLRLRHEMHTAFFIISQRSIDCVLECGTEFCPLDPLQEVSDSESPSVVHTDDNNEPSEHALPEIEQDLPLLIGRPRRKTPEEIRAAEAASRYSVSKRCNCLTHQKRASWSPSTSHEASKVSKVQRQEENEAIVKSSGTRQVNVRPHC